MRTTRVTAHRGGRVLHYTRHITPKVVATGRKNIKEARKVWMGESHLTRQKQMPSHKYKGLSQAHIKALLEHEGKRYVPVGGYVTLDVGRKGHHYVVAQKTKFGWNKVGYVTQEKVGLKGRRRWMHMSHTARAKAMPERKGRAGYVKRLVSKVSTLGHRFRSAVWERR